MAMAFMQYVYSPNEWLVAGGNRMGVLCVHTKRIWVGWGWLAHQEHLVLRLGGGSGGGLGVGVSL